MPSFFKWYTELKVGSIFIFSPHKCGRWCATWKPGPYVAKIIFDFDQWLTLGWTPSAITERWLFASCCSPLSLKMAFSLFNASPKMPSSLCSLFVFFYCYWININFTDLPLELNDAENSRKMENTRWLPWLFSKTCFSLLERFILYLVRCK